MKVPKYHMEDSFLSKEISMTISLSIFTHCDCVISEKIVLKVFFCWFATTSPDQWENGQVNE